MHTIYAVYDRFVLRFQSPTRLRQPRSHPRTNIGPCSFAVDACGLCLDLWQLRLVCRPKHRGRGVSSFTQTHIDNVSRSHSISSFSCSSPEAVVSMDRIKRKLGFGLTPVVCQVYSPFLNISYLIRMSYGFERLDVRNSRLTIHQKTSAARNTAPEVPPSPDCIFAAQPIDRQILPAPILADLRASCAKILFEVGPSGVEYDEILNQPDPLEKYHHDRKALTDLHTQSYKNERPASRTRQRSDSVSYNHKSANAARDVKPAVSSRSRNHSTNDTNREPHFEPLEPTHTTISGVNRTRKPGPEDPLAQIRATLATRPKTSAAACIDYNGPSAGTSSSTSRTATTYDPVRPSTGITSQAITPANEKRSHRTSEQLLQDGSAAAAADATAKAWMVQELARRRAAQESKRGSKRPSRGGSISSKNLATSSDLERSPSRTGSVRTGSIRSGIQNYIRPRASFDSMWSDRSESCSRPVSRNGDSSKATHHSWWRGASAGLRRKGSWSSFRSARTGDEEDNNPKASTGQNRCLDLNRSLPPLPGLDQYVEKKETRLHISQLMSKKSPSAKSPDATQRPLMSTKSSSFGPSLRNGGVTVVDHKGLTRTLSAEEEQSRQLDLRRLVQEKMLRGAISPTASSGGGSHGRTGSAVGSKEREVAVKIVGERVGEPTTERWEDKTPAVKTLEIKKEDANVPSSPSTKKKGGVRARWSRFLGGDKRVVVAN